MKEKTTQEQRILTDLRHAIDEYMKGLLVEETPVVGWCCCYVPIEVLEGAGLVPFRLLPDPPAEMGDACLGPNFCPYVRAILGEALAGSFPFLSGLVVMNTCDGMRRLSDGWSSFHKLPFVHLMDLPRVTTSSAFAYFREEIEGLIDHLSSHFGISISNEAIVDRLTASNKIHDLLQEIENLMGEGRLGLSGRGVTEVFRSGGILPRETYHSFLSQVIDESVTEGNRDGVPILLTGSMLENPEIVTMIEDFGGRVTAQDLCVGGRRPKSPISLKDDPLTALAQSYLQTPPCARLQENQRRIDHLMSLVQSHEIHGVIYYVLKFCDTFLYDAPVLKAHLDRMGIPMLIVESEYRKGRGGATQTRIQAFLEMLSVSEGPGQMEATQ